MTDAEAAAVLQELNQRGLTAKLEEFAKLHDKLVDHMLDMRVAGGLITREQATALRKEQPFYTPLKGFALEGDMQLAEDPEVHKENDFKNNYASIRKGVKLNEYVRATGRKSMPFNPLFNLLADAQFLAHRVEVNLVGRTLLKAIMAAPDEHAQIARYYTDKQARIRYGLDRETGETVAHRENMRALASKEGLLVVKEAGKTYYIDFQKTEEGRALQRAFTNMEPKKLGKFMQVWANINNGIKGLLTYRNPLWLAGPAYLRDMQDAITTAYASESDKNSPAFGKKIGARTAKYVFTPGVIKAVAQYISGAEPKTTEEAWVHGLLSQMIQDGGAAAHARIQTAEQLASKAEKTLKRYAEMSKGNPLAHMDQARVALVNTLDAAAEGMDMQARFATYRAALDAGLGRDDAARLALNSSLDLTRRGEWSNIMDNLFWFFSPTVESGRKLIKMGLTPKNGARVMGTFVTMGVLSTLWNASMSGDDDDDGRKNYLDVPAGTRQSRFVLFYGKGANDYVAIPLGFMMGFPKYLGERVTEAAMGATSGEQASVSITEAVTDLAGAFATSLSPVRVTGDQVQQMVPVPSMAKPFTDLIKNTNNFGSPIYNKQFDTDRARATMGREQTNAVWKWIATSLNNISGGQDTVSGAIDFQPEQYRYLASSFLGGPYNIGKQVVNAVTGNAEEGLSGVPVISGFVGKGAEYIPGSNFYKNSKRIGAMLLAEKEAMKEGDFDSWDRTQAKFPLDTDPQLMGMYKAADAELKKLNVSQKQALLYSEDAQERKDIMDSYREMKNDIYTSFNQTYNETKKDMGK
jgi:hypothetical protein